MGLKGQTGGSLGGGVVGRKQLKAQHKPDLLPVDPQDLDAGSRARREAYQREQLEREERAHAAAERRQQQREEDARRQGRSGRRVLNASEAVSRFR